MKYVIISPIRDEEDFIEKTLLSVINQTLKPIEWVIVNDGSTDRTADIIEHYASKIMWIRAIHRKDRGFRKPGGGVIEAFYDGYSRLSSNQWDFIVKLDGDLMFNSNYFERCFDKFIQDNKLGIGGGTILNLIGESVKSEKNPIFHVRGATKIYRKEFWHSSGGLMKAPGWDTLDEVKANMLGWKTRSFSDIHLFQLKETGAADGTWKNAFKNGTGSYIAGYHPIFMISKCIMRLFERPYISISVGLLAGYLSGYISGLGRIQDKELFAYLRKQQLRRLLFIKSIWN